MSDQTNQTMQVVKKLDGFSCAHRHYAASSHCQYVHGYERSFRLVIEGQPDPTTGWVIDFGAFKPLRAQLAHQFDHTLIISAEDPLRSLFEKLDETGGCQLRIMDNPGMEGAARWVWDAAQEFVRETTEGRARLVEVEAREADRNAVRYRG